MKFAKMALVSLTFPSALCSKWNTRSLLRRNGGDFNVTSQQIDLNGQGLLMPASGCLMIFFVFHSVLSSIHSNQHKQARSFALQPCQLLSVTATLSPPRYITGVWIIQDHIGLTLPPRMHVNSSD